MSESWIERAMIFALMVVLAATTAAAQESEPAAAAPDQAAMMAAWQKAMTPGEPHAALARGVGSWKMTTRAWMDPAAEPMVSEGTADRQMILGGRVLEERMASNIMGMEYEGIARIGYDNVTGRYWSSWIDTMSTGVYVQHGQRGEDGSTTFHGEYDDPVSGGKFKVRSVLRWEDDDTQQFEWYEDRGDGEVKTMVITYERAGS